MLMLGFIVFVCVTSTHPKGVGGGIRCYSGFAKIKECNMYKIGKHRHVAIVPILVSLRGTFPKECFVEELSSSKIERWSEIVGMLNDRTSSQHQTFFSRAKDRLVLLLK